MKLQSSIFKSERSIYSFLAMAVILFFSSCSAEEEIVLQESDSEAQEIQTVIKSKGQSALRSAGVGNGVNLQPSYYNNGNVTIGWSLMQQYSGIETVRIEIEPDRVTQGARWIREAHENGFSVIATYHESDNLGSDNTSHLDAAANWWVQNYSTLTAGGSITLNLMNEWGSHDISSSAFASAYNSAISKVRQVYGGTIIIDIPGWGQEAQTAANATSSINDGNIAYSVHIYPGAWNQSQGRSLNTSDLDYLGNSGKPCIVGEFGDGGSGSADWSGLVDHAVSKGWSVLGWCWNGDGGNMNMVTPSWANNSTATSFSASSHMNTIISKLGGSSSGGGGSSGGNCGTDSSGYPYCCDSSSDPDGDGWGWENNQSCVVNTSGGGSSGGGSNNVCGTSSDGYPYCCDSSSDPDGDGWGWENDQSCVVNTSGGGSSGGGSNNGCGTSSDGYPYCCDSSSDPDGDGWGWENDQSCVVNGSSSGGGSVCGTNAPNGYPYCCDASSDPDGDGWGWENSQSCVVY